MSDASEFVISDAAAAKALTTPEVLTLLAPFMRAPSSLSQVSGELHIPLPRLHYWVQRFLTFGVLRVQREERRTGKSIKYYEATAQRLIVPERLLSLQHSTQGEAAWASSLRLALERHAPELLHVGDLSLQLDGEGHLSINRLTEDGARWDPLDAAHPAALNTWVGSLRLAPETAKQLQARLMDVVSEYVSRPADPEGDAYLLHLALAPQIS